MHKSDQMKKLRAMELINRTVLKGEKMKTVAQEMGISEDTAQRTLKWAGDANLFVQYEQRLYSELLPLAHEAIKLALQDGDAQVALKIMDAAGLGAGRLKGTSKAAQQYEEGLYGELARQRDGWVIDVTPERRELGDGGYEPDGEESVSTVESDGDSEHDVPVGVEERRIDGLTATATAEGTTGIKIVVQATEGERSEQ